MIKTIIEKDLAKLDEEVNEFCKRTDVQVFATHTDWKVWVIGTTMTMAHKATIFYKENFRKTASDNWQKPQESFSSGNKGVEAGAGWLDRNHENMINAVWKDGTRSKIDKEKLVENQQAQGWDYIRTNGSRVLLRRNNSDNPKAPIYRIYHT